MSRSAKIEKITPEKAAAMLEKNCKNRNLSSTHVAKLAGYMSTDQWIFDGAPIRISTEGDLLDGQHRLTAVVRSKISQDFVVVRDVEPSAQFVIDTGKTRSLGDALSILGETGTSNLAATIYLFKAWAQGVRGQALTSGQKVTAKATIPTLLSFFESVGDEVRSAAAFGDTFAKGFPITKRFASLTKIIFDRIDSDDSEFFFDRLASGAGLEAGSPILVLRNRLLQNKIDRTHGRETFSPYVELAFIIKAWNAYRDGVTIERLRFVPGGKSPEDFPEPR